MTSGKKVNKTDATNIAAQFGVSQRVLLTCSVPLNRLFLHVLLLPIPLLEAIRISGLDLSEMWRRSTGH